MQIACCKSWPTFSQSILHMLSEYKYTEYKHIFLKTLFFSAASIETIFCSQIPIVMLLDDRHILPGLSISPIGFGLSRFFFLNKLTRNKCTWSSLYSLLKRNNKCQPTQIHSQYGTAYMPFLHVSQLTELPKYRFHQLVILWIWASRESLRLYANKYIVFTRYVAGQTKTNTYF